ncbi:hypothetical protein L6452_06327 [Arctium lappa]|uniref:Uncharacterized protein n=1 Tax=Arctium lappa TaxID=4217 RepID=A0ACB9EJ33_ARCLA|nr:hypothetical protein L6452_06327 [Arctium lappa]
MSIIAAGQEKSFCLAVMVDVPYSQVEAKVAAGRLRLFLTAAHVHSSRRRPLVAVFPVSAMRLGHGLFIYFLLSSVEPPQKVVERSCLRDWTPAGGFFLATSQVSAKIESVARATTHRRYQLEC